MGKAADKETKEPILQIAGLHPEIIFVRNLMAHDYGFGYFVVSMCAEGYKKDREQLYMVANQISYELYKRFHCDCFIQTDYLLQDETLTHTIGGQINSLLKKYGNELQVDNFRLIENGAGINIAFNMIYPAEMQKWEEEIRKDIEERIELADSKYHALIKGMIRRERFSLSRKR